jgi:putative addiction module component (TIGR02574 family)
MRSPAGDKAADQGDLDSEGRTPADSAAFVGVVLSVSEPEHALMASNPHEWPIEDRLRLVEDLWNSISADQSALPLKDAQRRELDRRLDAHASDPRRGRSAEEVVAEIQKRI